MTAPYRRPSRVGRLTDEIKLKSNNKRFRTVCSFLQMGTVRFLPVFISQATICCILVSHQGCRNHGCSGCKCTPCLLHFQLCGCSAGADYGCNGCTKLLQQTELNVARGCVWGCSTPSRQEFGKVVTICRKEKRKTLLMEFWREITEKLWLNNFIRSEKIW